jgi:hypothetical protein
MSQPNNLPTVNQFIGPGGQFPQTVPAYSTVPEQNQQKPQQPQQPSHHQHLPHGLPGFGFFGKGHKDHKNQSQQQQGPQQQGGYPPQQGGYPPQQGYPGWNNQPGYAQQQGNWGPGGYPQQQYYYNFSNDIYSLRNQYGMQIPDNQIDQTLDAAKANKRMYAFPEPEKTYIRYDEKGKSYILAANSHKWAHKDNKQYFDDKKDANSYDGTAAHLIKVCWLDMKLPLKHVKPGNYQLFLNQAFENAQIRGTMKIKVLVGDRQVFNDEAFPNAEMIKNKNLTESYICNIKREDFDMNKLDQNGDAVVKVEIGGKDNSWKKGWLFDGIRLLEVQ